MVLWLAIHYPSYSIVMRGLDQCGVSDSAARFPGSALDLSTHHRCMCLLPLRGLLGAAVSFGFSLTLECIMLLAR